MGGHIRSRKHVQKTSMLDDSVNSKHRLLPPWLLLTVHSHGVSVIKLEELQACLGAADPGNAQREGAAIHGSLRSESVFVASSTSRNSLSCVPHDQCSACSLWSPPSLCDI